MIVCQTPEFGRIDMRRLVIIITIADPDGVALVWVGLVDGSPVCVMPASALNSTLHRSAAEAAMIGVTKGTDIEPIWPWDSDAISEG